ncbi:MAG: hypothetical protein ACRD27_08600 [Terracidiphilus sp.]
MQRGISIFLVLFFSLGPFAPLSQANEDANLPACCRRNGRHHCAINMQTMAAGMMLVPPGASPIAQAPSRCPYYPHNPTAWTTPIHALVPAPVDLPVPLAQPHSPAAARAAARLSQIRTRAGRGPPTIASV